jgi:hypothetical protein
VGNAQVVIDFRGLPRVFNVEMDLEFSPLPPAFQTTHTAAFHFNPGPRPATLHVMVVGDRQHLRASKAGQTQARINLVAVRFRLSGNDIVGFTLTLLCVKFPRRIIPYQNFHHIFHYNEYGSIINFYSNITLVSEELPPFPFYQEIKL